MTRFHMFQKRPRFKMMTIVNYDETRWQKSFANVRIGPVCQRQPWLLGNQGTHLEPEFQGYIRQAVRLERYIAVLDRWVKITTEKILRKGLKRMFWPKRPTRDKIGTKRVKSIIRCPQKPSVFVQTKLRIRGGNRLFPPFPFLVTDLGANPHTLQPFFKVVFDALPKVSYAYWLVENIASLSTSNFWPWLSSANVK